MNPRTGWLRQCAGPPSRLLCHCTCSFLDQFPPPLSVHVHPAGLPCPPTSLWCPPGRPPSRRWTQTPCKYTRDAALPAQSGMLMKSRGPATGLQPHMPCSPPFLPPKLAWAAVSAQMPG